MLHYQVNQEPRMGPVAPDAGILDSWQQDKHEAP